MIFLDSVFLFVFLKCLPVMVFCNNDHICNFYGVVLLLEIILERCCIYTRVQKYFSCQGRGGQVSPGVREEVVSSVLLGVREEIVYRDAPHLKR